MNANVKTLSTACAVALGVAMMATVPSAFAQVSSAQIEAALAPTTSAFVVSQSAPVLDPALAEIVQRTNLAELNGLASGASLQQGVVQGSRAAASDAPVLCTAPQLGPEVSGLIARTNAVEMNQLPSGASVQQGVVQVPQNAPLSASAFVATCATSGSHAVSDATSTARSGLAG